MAKADKYTIKNLQQQFPNDDVCLDFLFDVLHSRKCSCGGSYSRVKGRKQYQCSKCRFQIAPTAGTIFHKSATPLTTWFYALFIFSNAKSGISAKELERQIGVTYKCAWRMLKQIRKALGQDGDKLSGDVEMDTAFFGGTKKAGKDNWRLSEVMKTKGTVMGAFERGGKMRATVVPNHTGVVHNAFIETDIEKGSRLLTDGTKHINVEGYTREKVQHSKERVCTW
jgi:transposase